MSRTPALALISLLSMFVLVPPIWAATFTVTSTADAVDAKPGDGRCATAAGTCTLRAAVQEANASPALDTINLPSGTYRLTRRGDPGDASSGDLDIGGDLRIVGRGNPVIDANGATLGDRAIHVTGAFHVSISGLTITGGRAESGGAVFVAGGADVTFVSSVLTANYAEFNGGAIRTDGGARLTLDGSTISNNQAPGGSGGGVFSAGTLIVYRSTVSGNHASGGGGIYNFPGFDVTVTRSLIVGNAASAGAGIFSTGFVTLVNSTVSGNTATERGGGLDNDNNGTLTITNSTIASNKAPFGGGIWTGSVAATRLRNTLLANNSRGGNCFGNTVDRGGNLTWPDGTCVGIQADPHLAPLAKNGGPTLTHALLTGSAAIDAAVSQGCPDIDQRGATRPQGHACDIGAFEFPAPLEVVLRIDSPNQPARWGIGSVQRIVWWYNGTSASFRLEISRDGGQTWTTVATVPNRPGPSQDFEWRVTGPATQNGRVRVRGVSDDVGDVNDAAIVIAQPFVRIVRPVGGTIVRVNSALRIFWQHNLGAGASMAIDASRDNGLTWSSVGGTTTTGTDTASFTWVPTRSSTQARVRVRALDGSRAAGTSGTFVVTSARSREPVTLDWDTFPDGSPIPSETRITTQFLAVGLDFVVPPGPPRVLDSMLISGGPTSFFGDIQMRFTQTTQTLPQALTFEIVGSVGAGARVELFDVNGRSLAVAQQLVEAGTGRFTVRAPSGTLIGSARYNGAVNHTAAASIGTLILSYP